MRQPSSPLPVEDEHHEGAAALYNLLGDGYVLSDVFVL